MSGDRPFRLSEQEMRGMLRRDMTELVSGFIPEPGAEELGALLEFVGACATSRAAAQDAVSKTLALLEDLALVADDQSWAPLRERLEERLKGAMGLREALFNYLPTTGPVEGLREGLLRERVEKALGLRESGEAQPDPLALAGQMLHAMNGEVEVLRHQLEALRLALGRGRPSGSHLRVCVQALGAIWTDATGRRPTISTFERDDGSARGGRAVREGDFLRYCELALACNSTANEKHAKRLEGAARHVVERG